MFLCGNCTEKSCQTPFFSAHATRSYGQCESCKKVGECVECPPRHAKAKTPKRMKEKKR